MKSVLSILNGCSSRVNQSCFIFLVHPVYEQYYRLGLQCKRIDRRQCCLNSSQSSLPQLCFHNSQSGSTEICPEYEKCLRVPLLALLTGCFWSEWCTGSGLQHCVALADVFRVLWIAFYADVWVYPVLLVLGWPARILFMLACWLMMFACYFTGEFVTSFLWREYYLLAVSVLVITSALPAVLCYGDALAREVMQSPPFVCPLVSTLSFELTCE